jgi:hypothetical protein
VRAPDWVAPLVAVVAAAESDISTPAGRGLDSDGECAELARLKALVAERPTPRLSLGVLRLRQARLAGVGIDHELPAADLSFG